MTTAVPRFGSLLLVEEKLLEAEYFLRRMRSQRSYAYGFELSAFLSAARSVTFLVQKEMSKVPHFKDWWDLRRAEMRDDPAMRFFLELRNFSQKAGRVSIKGFGSGNKRWTHWFISGEIAVPDELIEIEATDACRLHLAKIARLVLQCGEAFPYHTCPHQALTTDGIRHLSLDLDDLDEALGYSRGMSRLDGFGEDDRLAFMRRHFDGVDFQEIRRISRLRQVHKSPPEIDPIFDMLEQLALYGRRSV